MRTGDAEQQRRWGNSINVVLPRFENGGTHVNVSGAVVSKYAPNRKAVQLLEFLVSDHAQAIYAKSDFEYPVKPGVKIDPIIASFGKLKVDSIRLSEIARYRKTANLLVDKITV
jgi:iron(III) transport system substrate-binding protein